MISRLRLLSIIQVDKKHSCTLQFNNLFHKVFGNFFTFHMLVMDFITIILIFWILTRMQKNEHYQSMSFHSTIAPIKLLCDSIISICVEHIMKKKCWMKMKIAGRKSMYAMRLNTSENCLNKNEIYALRESCAWKLSSK